MTNQQGAPEALRLADEWQRKTQREADRQNSAYDRYGMGNTPETVDPLGAKMAAELRRLAALLAQQPSPSAAAASKAVLAAIRAANMQLVRTGDDEFMLVTFKQATPQADSQPAPVVDREAVIRAAVAAMPHTNSMVADDLLGGFTMHTEADDVIAIFEAGRAASAPADCVTAPAGGVDDDVDAIALARYKVVPSHESMFHRFAVVAGDGKQQLYLGREVECENMARKFAGAFLDGVFYQSNIAPTPPAQAADSVLEDAARLDWIAVHGTFGIDSVSGKVGGNGQKRMAASRKNIDAARKQGGA